MALATLDYSRICHIYNIYSSINRGVNKKEGVILSVGITWGGTTIAI